MIYSRNIISYSKEYIPSSILKITKLGKPYITERFFLPNNFLMIENIQNQIINL